MLTLTLAHSLIGRSLLVIFTLVEAQASHTADPLQSRRNDFAGPSAAGAIGDGCRCCCRRCCCCCCCCGVRAAPPTVAAAASSTSEGGSRKGGGGAALASEALGAAQLAEAVGHDGDEEIGKDELHAAHVEKVDKPEEGALGGRVEQHRVGRREA